MKIPALSTFFAPHEIPARLGARFGAPPADEPAPDKDPAWLMRCEHDYLVEAQIRYSQAVRLWIARRAPHGEKARGLCRDFAGEQNELTREIIEASPMNDTTRGRFLHWAAARTPHIAARLERIEREEMLVHAQNLHEERLRDIFSWCGPEKADYEDACGQLEECFRLATGQGLYSGADAGQALALAQAGLTELFLETCRASGKLTDKCPERTEEAHGIQAGNKEPAREKSPPGFTDTNAAELPPATKDEAGAPDAAE